MKLVKQFSDKYEDSEIRYGDTLILELEEKDTKQLNDLFRANPIVFTDSHIKLDDKYMVTAEGSRNNVIHYYEEDFLDRVFAILSLTAKLGYKCFFKTYEEAYSFVMLTRIRRDYMEDELLRRIDIRDKFLQLDGITDRARTLMQNNYRDEYQKDDEYFGTLYFAPFEICNIQFAGIVETMKSYYNEDIGCSYGKRSRLIYDENANRYYLLWVGTNNRYPTYEDYGYH